MHCARTNANIAQADCHTIILGTTDNAKFTVCRSACLYGIGLVQSVRQNNYAQPGPAAGLMEATTMPTTTPDAAPSATQSAYPHGITLAELSTLAGVKYQNAWATVKDLRNGKPATSPASKAIMAKLAELGLTLDNLTPADRKAAAAEKLKPAAPSSPKPEAKPMLQVGGEAGPEAMANTREEGNPLEYTPLFQTDTPGKKAQQSALKNNPLARFVESLQQEGVTPTPSEQAASKAVERILAAGKPVYFGIDMAKGFDEQYLDRLPLETIIAAVHRRMPGAVVVCKAG